jgi:hypothetical protein
MRAKEFLSEAKLKSSDFYKKDRLISFIKRLQSPEGSNFTDDDTHEKINIKASRSEIKSLKDILPYYDESGNLRKDQMSQLIPNSIGGVKLSRIFKDEELGGKGGSKGEDSEQVDVKKFNIGPAVEAWKAIGIFAKLIHRENSPVTINELMSIKLELESSMQLEKKSTVDTAVTRKLVNVPDFNGSVQDSISVKIDIGLGPFQRAMRAGPEDPPLWGRIQGIIKFINENKALQRYSNIFAKNGRQDPIKVAVVGGAGKKTDVRTSYLDPETDYKTGKQIVGMSFSLKAGNAGVSQSPGTTEEGIRIMFRSLGLSDQLADQAMVDSKYKPKARQENETAYNSRLRSLVKIMKIAAVNLDNELKQLDANGEKVFLKNFINELKNAVTSGEGLIFVEFDPKGTYEILNPNSLQALVEYVDLESKIVLKTTPYIFIYDKNSKKNLAHIRLEVQNSGRLILKYELDDLINLAREANQKVRQKTLSNVGTVPKANMNPTPANITPPGIINKNRNLANKIPMGSNRL